MGALNGQSLSQVQAKIAKEFVPIMLTSYKVWPLAGLVNFALVPPPLRVLFGNIVAVFWLIYLIKSTAK